MQIALKHVFSALHRLDDVLDRAVDISAFSPGGVAEVADVMVTDSAVFANALPVGVERNDAPAVVTAKRGHCIECVRPEGDTLKTHRSRMFGSDPIAAPVVDHQLAIMTGQYMHWLISV